MIRTKRAHLTVATQTHPGLSGKINEDRLAVASFHAATGRAVVLAVVADGIGGHLAGEVAAEVAVQRIVDEVAEADGTQPLQALQGAIQTASQAIAERSAGKPDQAGMGSTCACAWVDGDQLYTAYVGDSRIYLVRNETIQRLTVDHSWVQEAIEKGVITPEQAHDHPNVHVLRRHLGTVDLPKVDTRMHLAPGETDEQARHNQGMRLQPGDILLLCTDGLTDMVWDDEILRLITTRNSLSSAAEDLVARANERGGHDNITVALLGVPRPTPAPRKKKGFLSQILGR
ncbi:MAG TPA: PP2C family serine/threonine-protein phosphatase [Anaerolineales bacterium]|nr:PP2C family serine/threonine-protein phosphatase [Anaerolineales bacterium]